MSEFQALCLGALLAGALASWLAYQVATRMLARWTWLQSLGRKLHQQKMSMLRKPPLLQYHRMVKSGNFFGGIVIIAALILFKSLACGLLGLITVFYLPLGVAAIPPLAAEHGDQPGLRQWVATVTTWQLLSHLLAACVGFAATWLWISRDISPWTTLQNEPAWASALLAGSLVTGLAAAWVETSGHYRKGFL